MVVGITIKLAIAEVASQQAELPHVVGDVFANVADGAVGADDYFLVFLGDLVFLCVLCVLLWSNLAVRGSGPPHHPASFVLAFVLEGKHAGFLQLGKGRIPEMQVQDFALARQEVVFDVEPVHGLKMAAQHGDRDQIGDGSRLRRAIFDGVQRLQTHLQILLVLGVPLRNASVEIPAVVVEARLAGQGLDFRARFLLDVSKPDNHVGDLHAGVVDVVLNVDFPARIAQQADERVAENGVAQMSDVRGLVGIDAGVLDQNLAGRNLGGRLLIGGESGGHPGAVDPDVEVAGRRDLHFGDAFDRRRSRRESLRRSSAAPSAVAWRKEKWGSRSRRVRPSEAVR